LFLIIPIPFAVRESATPLALRTILIISMGGGGNQSEGGAAFPTAASVLALTGN